MIKWISGVLNLIKLPKKLIASIAIPSGFLVIAPESILVKLGLQKITEDARIYISFAFIISTSLLIVELILFIFKLIKKRYYKIKNIKLLNTYIENIDRAELLLLREFFIQGQSSIKLPLNHPVVAGLIKKGIIEQIGSIGQQMAAGIVFPFRINEDIEPSITNEVLKLPLKITKENAKQISEERPAYVISILNRDHLFDSF